MRQDSSLNLDGLLQLIDVGVIHKPPKSPGSMRGAYAGGKYQGCPGKDIYFALSWLDGEQMRQVAEHFADIFPKEAPSDHVGYAACLRYVYGQFEKQGVLRSKDDFRRMKKEMKKRMSIDWETPRRFISKLQDAFLERDNYYGMTLTCEMEGHRLGDEAVIHKSPDKLEVMERKYLDSVAYAKKCGSWKQHFTPYYWAARYFMKFQDKEGKKRRDKAHEYSKKTLEMANDYCPDSRNSYVHKLRDCIEYLYKRTDGQWLRAMRQQVKNKCVQKAFEPYHL